VDAVDKNGLILPVSMWVKKLETSKQPRCLVVMEPVERTVAVVKFAADVSCFIFIFPSRGPLWLRGCLFWLRQ
jgi:PAS domain-containing serine/threonine kinase